MKEKIGMYKGKFISQMNREELLDFAEWSAHEIERLQAVERDTQEIRLEKEIKSHAIW